MYFVFRKKLFRFEAAASPGLGEKGDLVSIGNHGYTWVILDREVELLQTVLISLDTSILNQLAHDGSAGF